MAYHRLPATATDADDTYSFSIQDLPDTADASAGTMEIIVAVKADANGNGVFASDDVADLLTNVANNGELFDDVQKLLFEQISSSEAADLLTAIANNKKLEW